MSCRFADKLAEKQTHTECKYNIRTFISSFLSTWLLGLFPLVVLTKIDEIVELDVSDVYRSIKISAKVSSLLKWINSFSPCAAPCEIKDFIVCKTFY